MSVHSRCFQCYAPSRQRTRTTGFGADLVSPKLGQKKSALNATTYATWNFGQLRCGFCTLLCIAWDSKIQYTIMWCLGGEEHRHYWRHFADVHDTMFLCWTSQLSVEVGGLKADHVGGHSYMDRRLLNAIGTVGDVQEAKKTQQKQ